MKIRGIFVIIITVLLDQWSKWAMIEMIKQTGRPLELTSFFNIYTVWNKGVSFGMFNHLEQAPLIFSALALGVSVLLFVWMWKADTLLAVNGLAAIIGGAIGNTIDRIRFEAVIDFLDFHIGVYHWPAFNVADTAIFLGVVALLCDGLFKGGKKQGKEEVAKEVSK